MYAHPLRFALAALAALIAAGGFPSPAHAATRVVANCNDSGAGSLRNAISVAQSGDNIDLLGLACTRILLTSGQLVVPQASLTLLGRNRDALTLDANANGRAIRHTGTGTLRVYRMTVANGRIAASVAEGGCIASAGTVELISSAIHHCQAIASGGLDPWAYGGAVSARNVLLAHSRAHANLAEAGNGGALHAWGHINLHYSQVLGSSAYFGGGVYANSVAATYSLVRNNVASGGGGIYISAQQPAELSLLLNKSTVATNHSTGWGGGVDAGGAPDPALIIDSTISGNIGYYSGASLPARTRILNSTITANEERNPQCNGALDPTLELHMESTIVSGNLCPSGGIDIGAMFDDAPVTGSHNLVGVSLAPLPPDTIVSSDLLLTPLFDNGGPTPTHAPEHGSPAIDRGSNPQNLQYDQRGPGFPRVQGAFAEIGAVERPAPRP